MNEQLEDFCKAHASPNNQPVQLSKAQQKLLNRLTDILYKYVMHDSWCLV